MTRSTLSAVSFPAFSLRAKLLGIVAVLSIALLSVAAYQGIHKASSDSRRSALLVRLNAMADDLLLATSRLALERGITNTLLTRVYHGQAAAAEVVDTIHGQRRQGDDYLARSLAAAGAVEPGEVPEFFWSRLRSLEGALARVKDLRRRVDGVIGGSLGRLPQVEWFEGMTALIDSATEMRHVAFASEMEQASAIDINLTLKQAIWLVSEYAGQERALLGQVIAAGKPLDSETQKDLTGKRAVVDLNVRVLRDRVQALTESHGSHLSDRPFLQAIEQALAAMEERFLGRLQSLRERIYAAAPGGHYPVTSQEWLRQSTDGIDSVLALNQAVSRFARAQLEGGEEGHRQRVWLSAGLVLVCLLVAVFGYRLAGGIARRLSHYECLIGHAVEHRDLRVRVADGGRDELGRLEAAFDKFSVNVEGLASEVLNASVDVSVAASTMGDVSRRTREGIQIQEMETGEVSDTINAMMDSLNSSAQRSTEAAEIALEADREAKEGTAITRSAIQAINGLADEVQEASRQMAVLSEQNRKISGIVEVIRGIAEQTNLLALNAAIEAARAGESGRGFAVVADEVRSLASRTRESTEQIQQLIEGLHRESDRVTHTMAKSQEQARQSVQQSEMAGLALGKIAEAVNSIAEISAEIANTNKMQVDLAGGITTNLMANVRQFAHLSNQSVSQTTRASLELAEAVASLQSIAQGYKITGSTYLSLQSAKASHLAWKSRIRAFLDGRSSLSREEAVSHHDCAFGKWYYSDAGRAFHDMSEMAAIEAPHAQLHQLIRDIVQLKERGRDDEANGMLPGIDTLSAAIIEKLSALEVKLGFGPKSGDERPADDAGDRVEGDVELF